jgi:hypothetical protein
MNTLYIYDIGAPESFAGTVLLADYIRLCEKYGGGIHYPTTREIKTFSVNCLTELRLFGFLHESDISRIMIGSIPMPVPESPKKFLSFKMINGRTWLISECAFSFYPDECQMHAEGEFNRNALMIAIQESMEIVERIFTPPKRTTIEIEKIVDVPVVEPDRFEVKKLFSPDMFDVKKYKQLI